MTPINSINNMVYFTATTRLKELTLLQFIENNSNTTQKEMASVIGAAPSMVNVYLDNLEDNNYLVREYISQKKVNYKITKEGIKRKNYLLITHLHELLKLYRLAKENVEKFLRKLEDKGYRKILLYGAGEVAETILEIVKDRSNPKSEIVALIDDDSYKQINYIAGYKVISREEIKNYAHDVIVVTSYTYEDEIKEKLDEVGYPKDKVIRFFSG